MYFLDPQNGSTVAKPIDRELGCMVEWPTNFITARAVSVHLDVQEGMD